jgi:antirestriction protein ArdC
MKQSVYSIITNQIIKRIEESGQLPWRRPWREIEAYNLKSGKPYSFLNQMLLRRSGGYLTFKQLSEMGGHIKKGSKSEIVTFWKTYEGKEILKDGSGQVLYDEDGNPKHKQRFVLRYYRVFSVQDIDGVEDREIEMNEDIRPDEKAEAIIRGYVNRSGVSFQAEPGSSAYYVPSEDLVSVPAIGQFDEISEYYSTVFHEIIHSTGHIKRLHRQGFDKGMRFGSCDYSREELVAEIGSCFLRREAKIESKGAFENSAAYVENWAGVLRRDDHMIVKAAQQAEKAVKYILNESPDQ